MARHLRSLGVFLNGRAIPGHDDHGQSIVDNSFLLLFNGQNRAIYWSLPTEFEASWRRALDTERLQPDREPEPVGGRILTRARSVTLLESKPGLEANHPDRPGRGDVHHDETPG